MVVVFRSGVATLLSTRFRCPFAVVVVVVVGSVEGAVTLGGQHFLNRDPIGYQSVDILFTSPHDLRWDVLASRHAALDVSIEQFLESRIIQYQEFYLKGW